FGKKYGIYLIFLGFFLIITTILFQNKRYFISFLALITGMQNGIYLSYKGIICRTTHMTGTITDLGTIIGNRLVGDNDNKYKLYYCFINIGSCLFGMVLGGITYNQISEQGFYIPALGYILIGSRCFKIKKEVR
ncbi:MAG: DUF1275 family protein, partial [Fusobacteriaceae bacterium]